MALGGMNPLFRFTWAELVLASCLYRVLAGHGAQRRPPPEIDNNSISVNDRLWTPTPAAMEAVLVEGQVMGHQLDQARAAARAAGRPPPGGLRVVRPAGAPRLGAGAAWPGAGGVGAGTTPVLPAGRPSLGGLGFGALPIGDGSDLAQQVLELQSALKDQQAGSDDRHKKSNKKTKNINSTKNTKKKETNNQKKKKKSRRSRGRSTSWSLSSRSSSRSARPNTKYVQWELGRVSQRVTPQMLARAGACGSSAARTS